MLDRPERRNAVDGTAAHELAEAFRALDADRGPGNRLDPDGDGPMKRLT